MRAIAGLVQNLDEFVSPVWLRAVNPSSIAVDGALQDEKHMLRRLVAIDVESRGSRLSVCEIASRSFFIVYWVTPVDMQTLIGFKSLPRRVAKLSL
jgi:hypothetical protein